MLFHNHTLSNSMTWCRRADTHTMQPSYQHLPDVLTHGWLQEKGVMNSSHAVVTQHRGTGPCMHDDIAVP